MHSMGKSPCFIQGKGSKQVKVRDTDLEADQEINFLSSYTKDSPNMVVDN